MGNSSFSSINDRLNKMRREGVAFDLDKFLEAFELSDAVLARLNWLNNPVWWSDMKNDRCHLTIRKGSDVEFVRRVWADTEFMHSFHRFAGVLPESDQAVRELLNTEWSSTLNLDPSLHWIIRCPKGDSYGLLSLVDISIPHRRGEVVLGVLPGAPFGLSTAAMLMLFEFYFKKIKFNKMVSNVFEENQRSLKSTKHLGFRVEGKLYNEVMDPKANKFLSMTRLGLLVNDAYCQKNARLAKKLFS
jgi:RimJ/RimL family protein N-acetyltransferase